jgi:hypothetical protein
MPFCVAIAIDGRRGENNPEEMSERAYTQTLGLREGDQVGAVTKEEQWRQLKSLG